MKTLQAHQRATLLYAFMTSVFDLADKLFGVVFILIASSNGITPMQISIQFAVASISVAIFDYPSGNISDRIGRKKTAGLGYMAFGIGMIIYGMVTSFYGYIFAIIVIQLGIALISGSPISWLIDFLKDHNKMEYKDTVVPKLRGSSTLFAAVGALFAAYLVRFGYSIPLFVGGAIAIANGLVTLLVMEDNYGEGQEESIVGQIITNTKDFMKSKNMILLLIRSSISGAGFLAFILAWQVYGVEVIKVDPSLIGILMTVFMLIISGSSFLTAKLNKHFKPIHVSVAGTIIQGIGLLVVMAVPNVYGFVGGICVFELGFAMEVASYGAWLHDYIPSGQRATFFSGLSALSSLIGFFSSLLIGWIINTFGYTAIWLFAGCMNIGAGVFLMVIKNALSQANVGDSLSMGTN